MCTNTHAHAHMCTHARTHAHGGHGRPTRPMKSDTRSLLMAVIINTLSRRRSQPSLTANGSLASATPGKCQQTSCTTDVPCDRHPVQQTSYAIDRHPVRQTSRTTNIPCDRHPVQQTSYAIDRHPVRQTSRTTDIPCDRHPVQQTSRATDILCDRHPMQ